MCVLSGLEDLTMPTLEHSLTVNGLNAQPHTCQLTLRSILTAQLKHLDHLDPALETDTPKHLSVMVNVLATQLTSVTRK